MGLQRRVRRIGESLGVGIPSQLAAMLNLREGDLIEWDVTDSRAGILRAQVVRAPEARQ